jgi:hypothetical protein
VPETARERDSIMGGLVDSRAVDGTGRDVEVRDTVFGVCGRLRGVGVCPGAVVLVVEPKFEFPGVGSTGTAKDEVVWGAMDTEVACRDGPEERLDGAVANFAISRPSSPTRPWSSETSSLISRNSRVTEDDWVSS